VVDADANFDCPVIETCVLSISFVKLINVKQVKKFSIYIFVNEKYKKYKWFYWFLIFIFFDFF